MAPTGGSQGVDAPRPFLTELQVLTSRPVVEATRRATAGGVRRRVLRDACRPSAPTPSPACRLRWKLTPAGGTDIVELTSTGPDAELAATLVNGVIATYKQQLDEAYARMSGESLAQSADEVAKLEARVSPSARGRGSSDCATTSCRWSARRTRCSRACAG